MESRATLQGIQLTRCPSSLAFAIRSRGRNWSGHVRMSSLLHQCHPEATTRGGGGRSARDGADLRGCCRPRIQQERKHRRNTAPQ